MQKKLSLALSFVLLTGLTNSINADMDNLQKIAVAIGMATVGFGGYYSTNMNNEYSKLGKRSDLNMRIAKTLCIGTTILAVDVVAGDYKNTYLNLAKAGALFVSSVAITEPVANFIRDMPCIGGLLTDPVDKDGQEIQDFGSSIRFALTYVGLRYLATKCLS